MPILDPLRGPYYESGGLIQKCDECHWAQKGHKAELRECPECGADLGKCIALTFGGLAIVYLGKNFYVYQNCGGSISIEENDLPEVIRFLCTHGFDRRTGQLVRDVGNPRRIPWRKEFSSYLFDRSL